MQFSKNRLLSQWVAELHYLRRFRKKKKCRDIYAAGFFIWYRNAFPTFSRVQIVVFEMIWTKIHLTLFSFQKKLFLKIILVVRIEENFHLQLNEYSLNKKRVIIKILFKDDIHLLSKNKISYKSQTKSPYKFFKSCFVTFCKFLSALKAI